MEDNTSKAYAGTAGPMSPVASANGAGSALFVINLCASIAPVQIAGKNLPGLENYRLYQVSRVEDGRTRHRLRLGFFTSESHAQSVLTVVRQQYPTAFTTCLCDEDRRFTRGYLPETAAASPAAAARPPIAVVRQASAPVSQSPVSQSKQNAPVPAKKASTAGALPASAVRSPASPSSAAPPVAPGKAAKPAASKTLVRAEPEIVELARPPAAKPQPATASPASAAHPAPVQGAKPPPTKNNPTWQPPPLQAAGPGAASNSDTARHPILAPVFRAQPVIKAESAKREHAQAPAAAQAAKADSSIRVPALTLSEPAPVAPQTKARAPAQPFHVGRGVDIADAGIRLQSDPPIAKMASASGTPAAKTQAPGSVKTPPAAMATSPARVAHPTKSAPKGRQGPATSGQKAGAGASTAHAVVTSIAAAPAKPSAAPPARTPAHSPPDLDSTQTIRALTSAELNDDTQEKCFAIQLAASEQPVNLDAMPHLDIFEAYRLYSVAIAGSGKIVHSLRLGFFREAVSAEAVSGYLKTFFGSPTVLRVSTAEQARFKEPVSRAPSAATAALRQEAKIVELSDARAARPVVPTVTMEVAAPRRTDPGATGSFRLNATGSFNVGASGSHKTLTPTLKPAAKSAGAIRRSEPVSSKGATGKYKMPQHKKSLSQQLLDEAREVALSESGIRKLPKNDSLLSRLVDKLTK